MRIDFTHNAPPEIKIAIWQIAEPADYFLSRMRLGLQEARLYAEVTHPEKQRQWLAARFMLRELLGTGITVLNNEFGKPYLVGGGFHVSLSHTQGFSAAVVSAHYHVGIDVEGLERKPNLAIRRLFMNPYELGAYANSEEPRHAFLACWCAKEALYKMLNTHYGQISFRENLWTEADAVGKFTAGYGYGGERHPIPVELFQTPELMGALSYARDVSFVH